MYFSHSFSLGFIIAISSSSLGFLLLLCLGFLYYALKDQSSNYVRLSRAVSAISQIKLLRSNSVEPLQENDEEQPIHLTRMSDLQYPIRNRPTLPEVIITEDEYGVKIKHT